MFDSIGTFLFGLFTIIVIGFIVFVFVALGVDFFMSIRHGIGTVSQDKNTVFVRSFEEKGGCVSFVDVYGSEGKICGSYKVTRYAK